MFTRTKIICTIGPAVSDEKMLLKLIDAGMNVARVNFSHGSHETHKKTIDKIKKARKEKDVPLAIMLDTKGPEVRLGSIRDDQFVVKKGDRLLLCKEQKEGDSSAVSLNPPCVVDDIDVGMQLLIDDGYIMSKVEEKTKDGLVILIKNDGVIKSHKGVNIPQAKLSLPALTDQDKKDILFGCEQDVDIIAASFIRSAEHVLEIKSFLNKAGHCDILIMSKIESAEGVHNFDAILQVSDAIMVARGDMGVELPLTKVPKLQKMMIRKSYGGFKSVVTATQMLESMIHAPLPTRAEVSDVANAIYDSTSCVMLSGETAVGKYPIDAVHIMKSTIKEAEKDFDFSQFFFRDGEQMRFNDISSSVALACVKTAYSAGSKAIFAFTNSGFTAKAMARFRPSIPIIALTPHEKIYHQLALCWGVVPVLQKVKNAKEGFAACCCYALQQGYVNYGDLVVISAGTPFGISGTTNTILVDNIGDVLVRGIPHKGDKRVYGKIKVVHDPKKPAHLEKNIAVISTCSAEYESVFKSAMGIVLQNHPEDASSERTAQKFAKEYKKPLLRRADGASNLLREGQLVTLDVPKGIVFKGIFDSEEDYRKTCHIYQK
ncbi:MAG: Pyruvate kinase [Chlamydiia bacterium]|nr:Pyruvate kinase [Chlamydiia bacterium]MCH9615832.1 Pyruvate kinase [Chlamydiia bacterium]MCH9628765.1 Pyruvate kinase [Chlamydiia bacterium]